MFTVTYLLSGGSVLLAILQHTAFNSTENILFSLIPEPSAERKRQIYLLNTLWLLLLLMPLSVVGQEPPKPNEAKRRTATLMAGVGNVLGWFGLHGEQYFKNDRLSTFVGVGYTPAPEEFDPSGPTFAIGLRGFTPGLKHRGFLALSFSQLATLSAFEPEDRARFYGPGLEAGYHYVAWGGFTFMASLGIGWAPGVPEGEKEVGEVLALGFGYTWRR